MATKGTTNKGNNNKIAAKTMPAKKMDRKEAIKAVVLKCSEENEFVKWMGIEFMDVSDSLVKARIKFRKELTNPYGMIHGGILFSLGDIVGGTLANMSGKFVSTVDGRMNYLEPAQDTEYIYCKATKLRSGQHLIVVRVELNDDNGKLIDDGSFTFYRSMTNVLPK